MIININLLFYMLAVLFLTILSIHFERNTLYAWKLYLYFCKVNLVGIETMMLPYTCQGKIAEYPAHYLHLIE